MDYFVYLIITVFKDRIISYVGYTNNLNKRIKLHNSSKGAKFTRGKIWKLVYYKKFKTKSLAMKYESFLKKNRKIRNMIKLNNL
jgi:putative endonuclease